ncbi:MAG TPA: oxidoreductase [Firmicutes bacterium]|jgi:predicted dehydrogenase|nr:oxidoreductase [Bacillota bacterium]HBK69681.1 oxidoreductase [Bacillota bacterium]HBT18177.1 oxidoreductase [Bacillota bacterium]
MIRFGVIGTNTITEKFIKGASLHKDFKLTAIYSRTQERGKAFADKYNVKDVFTELEDMAKRSSVDAVYIASPNALHSKQAITLLQNKKHVLCEKAVASNLKELVETIKTARENKVLFMEAIMTIALPNFKVIKDNLHKIGTIRRYFGNYCQYSSRYDKYKEGIVLNAFDPRLSNGSLMDIGVYCIHPLVQLFGKPNKLKANGLLLESGVDGQGSILFQYENMDGIIMYSKIANSHLPSEIQGELGNIVIDSINTPSNIKIYYKDGDVEDLSVPQLEDSMYYEASEFIDLIKAGKIESPIITHQASMDVMSIMDEARSQIGLFFPADREEQH